MHSSQGKRCLFLARKIVKDGRLQDGGDYEKSMVEEAKTGLTLVGLVAIVDPLRPEIRDVVSTLRGAGIRISMVRRLSSKPQFLSFCTDYSLGNW